MTATNDRETRVLSAISANNMPIYVNVAIPVPLYTTFSYQLAAGQLAQVVDDNGLETVTILSLSRHLVGCRVHVPFGKNTKVAIILSLSDSVDFDASKVKKVTAVIDDKPLIPAPLLSIADWASNYYHHPMGEVCKAVFPHYLETSKKQVTAFYLNPSVLNAASVDSLSRAPVQKAIYQFCVEQDKKAANQETSATITSETLNAHFPTWRPAVKALIEKSLIYSEEVDADKAFIGADVLVETAPFQHKTLELSAAQKTIYDDIKSKCSNFISNEFATFLLHGITGSGKTRIYMQLILDCLQQKKQCLILVPEISLTPQLINRLENAIDANIEYLHSAKSANARKASWHNIRTGKSQVLVGTRSAVFAPFQNLGLIVIDEEHDTSYKQQDGFRFHARDIAIVRAQKEHVPIVLGSATPSLESMRNAEDKYHYYLLAERAGNAVPPKIHLIDTKSSPQVEGLTPHLIEAIKNRLAKNEQSLVFLNRRGYAPVIMCKDCQWMAECSRCNAKFTLHQKKNNVLICHHCLSQKPQPSNCPECNSEALITVGEGTQKLEEHLQALFPDARVARLDRDKTIKKGQLEETLDAINNQEVDIIVGTQMLSKGHDFPNVTLVGVVNPDGPLFSTDYRATENIMQLMMQVSGRSGRGEKQGIVIIQTALPESPYYQFVRNHDYNGFAQLILQERKDSNLPPYSYMAIIRAEASNDPLKAINFLQGLHQYANRLIREHNIKDIDIYPPLPASMEKRQGRYRAQWVIISKQRNTRAYIMDNVIRHITQMRPAPAVRWSVDIDPIDMF